MGVTSHAEVTDPELLMGEVTAELRALAADRDGAPPFSAVRSIVDYLHGRWGDLMSSPTRVGEIVGLSAEQVCDLVSGLGTFLGQSRRQSAGRATAYAVRQRSDDPAPTVAEYLAQTGQRRAARDKSSDAQMKLWPMHTEAGIVLPSGWERSSIGRELDRAVANIVMADPDDSTLRRWMLRQWGNAAVSVSFELVASLWTLARLGRVHEIGALAALGQGNPSLARALADAWDLLEVSRAEAVSAVERLCISGRSPASVLADVSRARWLAESDLLRVERAAQRAETGEPRTIELLEGEVKAFASLAAADSLRLRPERVADLNVGQVRRLCESVGLDPEGDGRLRRQVAGQVSDAGLGSDADRVVSLGVAAHRAGLEEMFNAALALRAQGDLEWASELHSALGITA